MCHHNEGEDLRKREFLSFRTEFHADELLCRPLFDVIHEVGGLFVRGEARITVGIEFVSNDVDQIFDKHV